MGILHPMTCKEKAHTDNHNLAWTTETVLQIRGMAEGGIRSQLHDPPQIYRKFQLV